MKKAILFILTMLWVGLCLPIAQGNAQTDRHFVRAVADTVTPKGVRVHKTKVYEKVTGGIIVCGDTVAEEQLRGSIKDIVNSDTVTYTPQDIESLRGKMESDSVLKISNIAGMKNLFPILICNKVGVPIDTLISVENEIDFDKLGKTGDTLYVYPREYAQSSFIIPEHSKSQNPNAKSSAWGVWPWIGLGALLLCCMGCMMLVLRKKRGENKGNGRISISPVLMKRPKGTSELGSNWKGVTQDGKKIGVAIIRINDSAIRKEDIIKLIFEGKKYFPKENERLNANNWSKANSDDNEVKVPLLKAKGEDDVCVIGNEKFKGLSFLEASIDTLINGEPDVYSSTPEGPDYITSLREFLTTSSEPDRQEMLEAFEKMVSDASRTEKAEAKANEEYRRAKAEMQGQIDKAEAEKKDAIDTKKQAVKNAVDPLYAQLDEKDKAIQSLKEERAGLLNDKEKLQANLDKAKEDIQTLNTSMENYRNLLTSFPECKSIAQKIHSYLNEVKALECKASELMGECVESAPAAAKVLDKIVAEYRASAKRTEKQQRVYSFQMELLSATGFVLTGSEIEVNLSSQNDRAARAGDLQYKFFTDLKSLFGPSVILAESIKALPKLSDVSEDKVAQFQTIGKKLVELLGAIGYSVEYVELFTPSSKYPNVSIDEFEEVAAANSDEVTRIISMAVNFGSSNDKTKIAVKG